MHHEYNMPIIEIEAIRGLAVNSRPTTYQRNHVDRYDSRFDKKKNINRETFNFSPDSDADFTINVIYFFVGNSTNSGTGSR